MAGRKKVYGTKTVRQHRKRKRGEEPYSNYLVMEPFIRSESGYETYMDYFSERCGGGRRVVRK